MKNANFRVSGRAFSAGIRDYGLCFGDLGGDKNDRLFELMRGVVGGPEMDRLAREVVRARRPKSWRMWNWRQKHLTVNLVVFTPLSGPVTPL